MSDNPLTRTISRNRVSPEMAAAVLGDPAPALVPPAPPKPQLVEAETETTVDLAEHVRTTDNAEVSAKKGSKLTVKTSNFDRLTARFEPSGQKTPLNVRVDSSLSRLVHEKVFGAKARGIPLTKDALVSDALKLYFGIAE